MKRKVIQSLQNPPVWRVFSKSFIFVTGIYDVHDGGRREDLETILHANEAKRASRKRKQSLYEGFR